MARMYIKVLLATIINIMHMTMWIMFRNNHKEQADAKFKGTKLVEAIRVSSGKEILTLSDKVDTSGYFIMAMHLANV